MLRHEKNEGVGGATITGFRHCLERTDADIIVKIDGDGQMDPAECAGLIRPLVDNRADYSKGNRMRALRTITVMPLVRLVGNELLSRLSTISSGYYAIQDATCGYLAIKRATLAQLDLDRISRDYFFESDMLCHLGRLKSVIAEVHVKAIYGRETSHISVLKAIPRFLSMHVRRAAERIRLDYFASFTPMTLVLVCFMLWLAATALVLCLNLGADAEIACLISGTILTLILMRREHSMRPRICRDSRRWHWR